MCSSTLDLQARDKRPAEGTLNSHSGSVVLAPRRQDFAAVAGPVAAAAVPSTAAEFEAAAAASAYPSQEPPQGGSMQRPQSAGASLLASGPWLCCFPYCLNVPLYLLSCLTKDPVILNLRRTALAGGDAVRLRRPVGLYQYGAYRNTIVGNCALVASVDFVL